MRQPSARAIASYAHSSISYSTNGARNSTGNCSSAAATFRWISSVSIGRSVAGALTGWIAVSVGRIRFHRRSRRTSLTTALVAMRKR